MATRTIDIFGIEIDVSYSSTPYRPATRSEPAEGGEVEIESLAIGGIDLPDGFVSQRVMDKVQKAVESNVIQWAAEERDSALADRAEQRHEDRLMRRAA